MPGRIEVLGKHTDYAGGRSILCAVERGFVVVVAQRRDTVVRIVNAGGPHGGPEHTGASVEVDLASSTLHPATAPSTQHPGWYRYASTVVHRVARDFPNARRGADVSFASDLPPASGLSSSSALVVALFLAIDAANDLSRDATYRAGIPRCEALAQYLGAVENGRSFAPLETREAGSVAGVGTLGGSEDHTAILCCRAGVLSRYSFCPVRAEGVIPMPAGRTFVIAFSGVAAPKTASALPRYNELSLATLEIVRLWNDAARRNDATLADAVASATGGAEHIRSLVVAAQPIGFSVERLSDRLEQFLAESYDIIPRAADALQRGDLEAFGELVDASQSNAERLLGNQTPETMALAHVARQLGADAASAFGAGFGGSVWAMVRADSAEAFAGAWRDRYATDFASAEREAIFFTTGAHDGASEIAMEIASQ